MNIVLELEGLISSGGSLRFIVERELKSNPEEVQIINVELLDSSDRDTRFIIGSDLKGKDSIETLVFVDKGNFIKDNKELLINELISLKRHIVIITDNNYGVVLSMPDIMCNIDRLYSKAYKSLDDGRQINPLSEIYLANYKTSEETVINTETSSSVNFVKNVLFRLCKDKDVHLSSDYSGRVYVSTHLNGLKCIEVHAVDGNVKIISRGYIGRTLDLEELAMKGVLVEMHSKPDGVQIMNVRDNQMGLVMYILKKLVSQVDIRM